MKQISEAHNIDCMEYMRTIPDGYFDLAVVDPPYGGANSAVGGVRYEAEQTNGLCVADLLDSRTLRDPTTIIPTYAS